MACELFEEGPRTCCRAVAGMLIPSVYERERFCRTSQSVRCPTFRLYSLRGAPLPQEAYYALWVPAGRSPAEQPL